MRLVIRERHGYTLQAAAKKGTRLTCVQVPGDPSADQVVLLDPIQLVVLDQELAKRLGEEGAELTLTLQAAPVAKPAAAVRSTATTGAGKEAP